MDDFWMGLFLGLMVGLLVGLLWEEAFVLLRESLNDIKRKRNLRD